MIVEIEYYNQFSDQGGILTVEYEMPTGILAYSYLVKTIRLSYEDTEADDLNA